MMYIIVNSLHSICFRIYASNLSLHHNLMYVTVEKFQSNCEYTTEEKAAWSPDSAPMGIKAMPTAKFFIWCYKFQVQDYVVSKFMIFWFSKFFHFFPLLILVPIILAWCNSQHTDGQKYDINTRS